MVDGRVPSEPGSRASTEPLVPQGLGPTGFDPSRGEWPERAIRIAEALEYEVTTVREESLWCRLCEQDIGQDGQCHAPHCVLYNEDPETPSSHTGELESALRSLAAYVGAGGYNAGTVDPRMFENKVRWGIDHLVNAAVQRCADVVEEQSKEYGRATYGSIKRAILNLRTERDSDGSPKGGDAEGGSVACDDSAGPKGIAQTEQQP